GPGARSVAGAVVRGNAPALPARVRDHRRGTLHCDHRGRSRPEPLRRRATRDRFRRVAGPRCAATRSGAGGRLGHAGSGRSPSPRVDAGSSESGIPGGGSARGDHAERGAADRHAGTTGRRAHFARLRLLDPARFDDLGRYLAEAEGYAGLSSIAERIASGEPLGDDERAALCARFPHDPALQALANAYPESADALLSALIDRHGTGRVMFRNRRDSVGGFPGRQLDIETSADADASPQPKLLAEFEDDMRGAAAEPRALDYADDPRIEWLVRLLDAHRDDKFLLIGTTRAKVEAIDAALRTRTGARVASFHEAMTLLQ